MFNSLELIKVRLVGLNEPSTIKAIAQTVINSIEEHNLFLKELNKPINKELPNLKEIAKIIKNQILEAASFKMSYDLLGISSFEILEEYRKPKYRKIIEPVRTKIINSNNLFQDFHYWFIMELNGILIGTLKCHLKYINLNTLKKLNKDDSNISLYNIGSNIYDVSSIENKFKIHNDEINITDLYIHPNFRKLNFSKYLLNTIINFVKIEVLRIIDKDSKINITADILENNHASKKIFSDLKFKIINNENSIIKYQLELIKKDRVNEVDTSNFTKLEENKIFNLKYQNLKSIRKKRFEAEARLSRRLPSALELIR